MTVRASWLAAGVLLYGLIGSASAHRSTPAGSTAGLSIPSVSHGQMVVLADHRAAIMQLVDQQYPTDGDMWRLQAFVNLQYFYCVWGLFPGGLSDENSPFNECTHAYLAGVRALLVHLQAMPGDRTNVRRLSRDIDRAMLDHHASMILCRFSDEPFNSADVIVPRLSGILTDPSSLMAILALACAAAGCGALLSVAETVLRRREATGAFDRLALDPS